MDIEGDTAKALLFIDEHKLKDDIKAMFKGGVSNQTGWMFTKRDTAEFSAIQDKVLEMGYDSSGFGMMMRRLEHEILTQDSKTWNDQIVMNPLNYGEDDALLTLTGVRETHTSLNIKFDDANEEAAKVMETCGSKAVVAHMMGESGGDYGVMRSKYG